MKNIYQDKYVPNNGKDVSSGSFDFTQAENTAAQTPSEEQTAQPFMNQPYQQPIYYAPYPPPYQQPYPMGYPMPPVQLTQEQLAAILQQYGIQPQFQQPQPVQFQQPQQETVKNDSGMRVLYQSEDFDKPAPSYEDDYENEYAEDIELPKEKTVKQEAVKKPSIEDEIEIEEESVELPSRPSSNKSTLKIEEMEMSTFELNSILSRKGYSQPNSYSHQNSYSFDENDTPVNFGQSFKIEETVDEEVTDIFSSLPEDDAEEPKKKLPVSEIIRRCVLCISVIAIIIAGGMLINEYRLSKENDEVEEGISDLIITEPSSQTVEEEKTTKNNNKKETTTAAALTPEQQWAQIRAEYPNIIFPVGLQLKYARLYATNQDFVGYLEAKGVNLSLPIVQSEGNDDEYLKKNFYGKSTKYGCPFVTHVNNITELDQNTIIFGHHMNNGTVFGALDKYKTIDGFKAAPVITFNTLYKDYSWKVIAAFLTNAYAEEDNGYVFRYYFSSLSTEERFAAYLNELSQRSLYDTGVDVLPSDKLLTLSTCSHEFNEARFVVVARLVRPGESTDVDISRATVNPSPRYPQAYYSKKKLDNPYVNASRWEVG